MPVKAESILRTNVPKMPSTSMSTYYSVNSDSFKAFRKRMLLFYGLSIGSSIIGAIFVFPIRDRSGIMAIIITLFLVLILAALAVTRTLKRMREVWPTYVLTLGDDFILKTQAHHSDIRIHSNEIKAIRKSFTGDISVRTRDWKKFIIIPRSLNRLEEVEDLLARWKPIEISSKKSLIVVLSLAISVFAGILLILRQYLSRHLFTDHHLPTVIPMQIKITLFILVAISILIMWMLRRLPQIDQRTKPKRWVFIVMIGYLMLLAISMAVSIFTNP